ncbi:MAG: methyltransferase domain-containing protein [Micrococcales bacterium]|nr:methyltransferase domain-containing protein [Micrococcales bacterium]
MELIQQYWDDYAEGFDAAPDHGLLDPDIRGAWKELLRAWLPIEPGLVADLACGTGSLAVLAAELGHHVVGIDLSPEMVARAQAKTVHFGGAVRIAQGDVADPDIEDGSVDAVLARHILWTLPDPHAAIATWARLLRPGGRLILIEGQWASQADPDTGGGDGQGEAYPAAELPWAGGVPQEELRAAVEPLLGDVLAIPLTDPLLWGREITDRRYLLCGRRD